jgi:hypothetical protein
VTAHLLRANELLAYAVPHQTYMRACGGRAFTKALGIVRSARRSWFDKANGLVLVAKFQV